MRIPLVVRPVVLGAPAEVSARVQINYNVTFGYTGPFSAAARGLIPAATTAGTLADDPTDRRSAWLTRPAGADAGDDRGGNDLRAVPLFDADVAGRGHRHVPVPGATQVGGSGSGTSAEEINLLNPAAGTLHGRRPGLGRCGLRPFKLHTWLLGSGGREHDGDRTARPWPVRRLQSTSRSAA